MRTISDTIYANNRTEGLRGSVCVLMLSLEPSRQKLGGPVTISPKPADSLQLPTVFHRVLEETRTAGCILLIESAKRLISALDRHVVTMSIQLATDSGSFGVSKCLEG